MTSQILANIYLHEFDFYVRHTLKPLAYIRYGDDFLLFTDTKYQAEMFRKIATSFLADNLYLSIHVKNNVIVRPRSGVHYLGVVLYPSNKALRYADFQRIIRNTNKSNLQSYQNYVERYSSKKQIAIFMARKQQLLI